MSFAEIDTRLLVIESEVDRLCNLPDAGAHRAEVGTLIEEHAELIRRLTGGR